MGLDAEGTFFRLTMVNEWGWNKPIHRLDLLIRARIQDSVVYLALLPSIRDCCCD